MSAGVLRTCTIVVLCHATIAAAHGQAPMASGAPSAVVEGTVYDSLITRAPLGGATVYVVGSTLSTTSDGRGRFRIAGVPAGDQVLTFAHPAFDSAGVQAPQVPVRVAPPNKVQVTIATPTGASLVRASCPGPRAEQTGLLLGVVTDVDTRTPLAGARVVSRWFELTFDNRGPRYETLETSAMTGPSGVFRLCGVPADIPVFVRAIADSQQSGRVEVYFNRSDVAFHDFAVSLTDTAAQAARDSLREGSPDSTAVLIPRGSATVRGVVTDKNGRPLANVGIGLLDRPGTVRSDADGRFTLIGVPAGTQTLELRAIGFAPARRVVDLRSRSSTETTVALDRAAQTLASVRVLGDRSASRSFFGFEDRRHRGVGHFLTADEIAQHGGIYLGDALRYVPGLTPSYSSSGRTFTMRSTWSGDRCRPAYFLDGVRWYPLDKDPILELERLIPLQDVVGVEVYVGGGTVPVQFDAGSGCGSVVFWTKR